MLSSWVVTGHIEDRIYFQGELFSHLEEGSEQTSRNTKQASPLLSDTGIKHNDGLVNEHPGCYYRLSFPVPSITSAMTEGEESKLILGS